VPHPLTRRSFLGTALVGGATLALAGVLRPSGTLASTSLGSGPYGTYGAPNELGIRLPEGFTARLLAASTTPVPGTGYTWHVYPDGGATFATADGGWIYVSNCEAPGVGGVGAIRFAADGTVVDAYRILTGTQVNCAGGVTPWGTWLSCEEFDLHGEDPDLAVAAGSIAGRVWECDPFGPGQGTARLAMGRFNHEAAVVDPVGEHVYLTEDKGDGLLYRFTPSVYPDLSSGLLEAGLLEGDTFSWVEVPDPDAVTTRTALQFAPGEVTTFRGGEGMWFHQGIAYFTTKGDNRVHALEAATNRYEVIYDATDFAPDPPLRGVDNLVVDEVSGDIYVAEDGGNMEIVLLSAEGEVTPFLQVVGQDGSELTGPAFSPDGSRLYFSSQRGGDRFLGLTYEVTGPFRGARPVTLPDTPPPTTPATPAPVGPSFTGGRARPFGGGGSIGEVGQAFRSARRTPRR
jgi:secreted PhoX family phosphatase